MMAARLKLSAHHFPYSSCDLFLSAVLMASADMSAGHVHCNRYIHIEVPLTFWHSWLLRKLSYASTTCVTGAKPPMSGVNNILT